MTDHWQHRAACAGRDPAIFDSKRRLTEAREICATCPVITQCRAASEHITAGTWAGEHIKRLVIGNLTTPYLTAAHGTPAAMRAHYKAGEKLCATCRDADHARRCPTGSHVRRPLVRRPA